MKSTFKKLSLLILLSFICSTTTYRSYADPTSDMAAVEEETKPEQTLKKAKTKTTKFYGNGSFVGASNLANYPNETDFTPAKIITDKEATKGLDIFKMDGSVKLGMEKNFVFENNKIDSKIELQATPKDAKLSQCFLTYEVCKFGITAGLAESLFAGAAIQLAVKYPLNDMVTVGLGAENPQEVSFFGKDEKGKEAAKKAAKKSDARTPRKDVPVVCGMVKYNLPNELGDVTLSGLYRPLAYKDSKEKKTKISQGFGGQLSSEMPFKSKTRTVTINGIFGSGIGEYIPDLQEVENEPISICVVKNKVENIMAGGVHVTYEHHITTAIRAKIGVGGTKVFPADKDKKEAYEQGLYANLNVSYWFTEYTSFGMEYGMGHRKNVGTKFADGKWGQHAKAILSFKF